MVKLVFFEVSAILWWTYQPLRTIALWPQCTFKVNGSVHLAVCDEPAFQSGSQCLFTSVSVCNKTCASGTPDIVECTGYCRCEPICGGQCITKCCQLAYDFRPQNCNLSQGACTYQQVFYENSECGAQGQCICSAGYCGLEVNQYAQQVCSEGQGAPCIPCPRGSYKPQPNISACTLCPPGKSTRNEGSLTSASCVPFCSNGSYSVSGLVPCQPCPAGTYQDRAGQLACKYCPRGTNSTAIGLGRLDGCCEGAGCATEVARAGRQTRPPVVGVAFATVLLLPLFGR